MKTVNKVRSILAVSLLLVAVGTIALFWAYRQIESSAERRQRTHLIINQAQDLLSEMKDAETGQRGYAITGDEAFLEPYLKVQSGLQENLANLRLLTMIPEAQVHLDAVRPLIAAKMTHIEKVIEQRRQNNPAAVVALVSKGEGMHLMDSIREHMRVFHQIEEAALDQREVEFQGEMRNLLTTIMLATLLTLALALLFAWFIHRDSRHQLKNLVHLETLHLLGEQKLLSQQLQEANATLQISEEKLGVTLNSIGDGVIATDADARITLLNPLAEKLTGWTQAEACGRPVSEVFDIVNKDSRRPATIPVIETLKQGTVVGLANHTVLISRTGSECDIADSCAPIRDRDGAVIGAVLVFRDVTGEYAAQQAIHDQQFYTRSLIESNIDALMTTDPGGTITDVNKQMEALTGRSRAELIGTPFKNYFTDSALAMAGINLVLTKGKVTDYELTARAKDGKETTVSYNATTFHDRECILQGVFAAARDVTERKHLDRVLHENTLQLEAAKAGAEKANLAKSDFLSSMSHELRSPLNAILGFAQLMDSDEPPPSSTQKGSIDQILHAGWYLLELINEILDLAVVESGRLAISLEAVSLPEVILECQAMIEPQALKRGITMTFPKFAKPCYIKADHTRVKQVLINLLSNAIKYNKAEGSVTLSCTPIDENVIRICVKDTGVGLSAQNLAQLFQPFNRLGQEGGGEEGTGIGLVVSKRLVELMQGRIGVESTVDAGSNFWIELVAENDPHTAYIEAALAQSAEDPPTTAVRSRLVLYVEDNPANLKLIEQLIARRPDMRLLSAKNGQDGINLARVHHPEVILMDINLPGINGIEAMKILRADPATQHIPIVALSANAMPQDIEKGIAAGFFRYLTKPIKVPEFLETLNVALDYAGGNTKEPSDSNK